jgi:hypothetical protein
MNSLEAMNIEYGLSKRWLVSSLVLDAVFYICLISAVFISGPATKWVTLLAFALQLSIIGARSQSGTHYALGESVRRPAILQNGLGTKPSPLQFAKIHAKYGISFSGERITSEKYYESKTEAGPRRLVEITEESAFWTSELAERMATFLRAVILVVVGALGLALFAALQVGLPATRGELVAKVCMVTITVWCTGDLFLLWRRYESLARGVQRVLADCEAISSHPEVGCAAAVALGEYNCSLASAPVIPDFIYKRNREKLNIAWASRNVQDVVGTEVR